MDWACNNREGGFITVRERESNAPVGRDDGARGETRRDAANASREAPRRRETDDATFARIVAIHRPEPHIMLFKRKKSEE